MADGRHFEKPLNHHNLATVRRIVMKFGTMTHFEYLKPSDEQNFEFKNPRWRTATILKIVKSTYLDNSSTDLHEIWHGGEQNPLNAIGG